MATTTTTTKINGAPFYYWRKRDEHVMERRSATTNYKIAGLSLKNMGITGSISAALGNLVNLQSLDVSGNKFTGQIPASFLQLTALKFFDYAGNSFDPNVLSNDCLLLTGTFARVAKALTAFNQDCSNVNNNTYVGWTYGPPVTTTTTTTTTLTTSTSTSTNTATTTTTTKINGAPFFFKRDANIRDVNIERRDPNANRYILTTLSVSNLTLGGQVPSGICQLTNIQSLDLSANKFTGYLPNCLGNLKSLKYLNVDGNNFWEPFHHKFLTLSTETEDLCK
ncbi:L domain-like protein [Rhizoclosmatium globosum]|uniref:L domain-like protein n=1 Tax=Rhizoclosmatium globosum TaxID=329046 RepID=A0A1Y2C046_9FUNG|nr:L domain-like protein [Rhizoclosmatium globosum]|eukprot:ORY40346.1 L domain-like protein [Rhizoclosmatium globosum]